ncbi:hypothetical protein Tco_0807761 [Tanacetum coccineum]
MMESYVNQIKILWKLVSDRLSVHQYPTQSSKSPQSSPEPYPSDNFQMNSEDGKIVVQDVRGRYKANNQGRPFQRNTCKWEKVYLWNVGAQNRGGMINPGQAKPIKCYNCNGLGHNRHENVPRPEAASRFRLTSRTRCY